MGQQDPVGTQCENLRLPVPAASVSLVEVGCGPDVVVAADEVDIGAGVPDTVQGLQHGLVASQAEMGIIEPEVEDIAQQDEVVRPAGQVQQPAEFFQPLFFLGIGQKAEMGIGHEDGRRLSG